MDDRYDSRLEAAAAEAAEYCEAAALTRLWYAGTGVPYTAAEAALDILLRTGVGVPYMALEAALTKSSYCSCAMPIAA
jgi:hypothetical protein